MTFFSRIPSTTSQVQKQRYLNAGQPVPTGVYGDPNNPTVPAYTYADPPAVVARDAFGRITAVDPSKYSYPNTLIEPASAGHRLVEGRFQLGAGFGLQP